MNEKFFRIGHPLINQITCWIRALPLTLPVPQLVPLILYNLNFHRIPNKSLTCALVLSHIKPLYSLLLFLKYSLILSSK